MAWLQETQKAKAEQEAMARRVAREEEERHARAVELERREQHRIWAAASQVVYDLLRKWHSLEIDRILTEANQAGLVPGEFFEPLRITFGEPEDEEGWARELYTVELSDDELRMFGRRVLGKSDAANFLLDRIASGYSPEEALLHHIARSTAVTDRVWDERNAGWVEQGKHSVFTLEMTPTSIIWDGEVLVSLNQLGRPSDLEACIDRYFAENIRRSVTWYVVHVRCPLCNEMHRKSGTFSISYGPKKEATVADLWPSGELPRAVENLLKQKFWCDQADEGILIDDPQRIILTPWA